MLKVEFWQIFSKSTVDQEICIHCCQNLIESGLQINLFNFHLSYPIFTNNDSHFLKKHVKEGLILKIVLSDDNYYPKIAFSRRKKRKKKYFSTSCPSQPLKDKFCYFVKILVERKWFFKSKYLLFAKICLKLDFW